MSLNYPLSGCEENRIKSEPYSHSTISAFSKFIKQLLQVPISFIFETLNFFLLKFPHIAIQTLTIYEFQQPHVFGLIDKRRYIV